ncbi:MAG TPA: sigma-70 family RNA polymerase sigma factor [Anaeromyxobacteraceae bacterium]|nr:sigma-70 family RNA polymerase sigma factor [Anaeromyxobacteraceae bacterium]
MTAHRNRDELSRYLAAVGRFPRLSREEEHGLAVRARAGDAVARQRILRHNLGLVVAVVRRYALGAVRIDDVIQEGNLGLLEAVDRFDPDAGTRFATYAIWWVRAYVGKCVAEARSIVRPRGGTAAQADVSLDASINGEDDTTFVERVEDERPGPEAALMSAEAGRALRGTLERYRPRIGELGWDIVHNRIQRDDPHSLETVGARWGLSRERVRQVELRTKALLARCLCDGAAA